MKQDVSPEKRCEILAKGAIDFVSKAELLSKLRENRPLRIKAGFDPSRPDIHLGHLLLIGKLREFQDLGHRVIFVAGDWTACIGDPSGQNKTRPMISREKARQNAQTYKEQVFRQTFRPPEGADQKTLTLHHRLRRLDPDKTEFVFNSRWLDNIPLESFTGNILSRVTLARLLERNDFSERYKSKEPIGLHELIYPLAQAYDSVELKADMEIGGTDQLFNLLMGRELQGKSGQDPQCILTLPLLKGLDEAAKMSQSSGNTLSFQDSAEDIFGKVMSVTDDLMLEYWEILGGTGEDYKRAVKSKSLHPMKEKELLAESLTRVFWGDGPAKREKDGFRKKYSLKQTDDIPEDSFPATEAALPLYEFLMESGLSSSNSEARRLIKAGAVRLNDEKITNPNEEIDLSRDSKFILKVGRKAFKIRTEPIHETSFSDSDETENMRNFEENPLIPNPSEFSGSNRKEITGTFKQNRYNNNEHPWIGVSGSNDQVPLSREFYLPVLRSVESEQKSIWNVEEALIKHFGLSKKAVEEQTRGGNQRKVFNRTQWALTHLSKAELIEGTGQKGFIITPAGKNILEKAAKEGIKVIDQNFLRKNCNAFREWEGIAYSPDDSFKDEPQQIKASGSNDQVPLSREFYLPVLRSVESEQKSIRNVEEALIKHFGLSKKAVEEQTRGGNQRKVCNRTYWALTHLSKAELIERDQRKEFSITVEGKRILEKAAKEGIKVIDQNFLRKNCNAFREWESITYSSV